MYSRQREKDGGWGRRDRERDPWKSQSVTDREGEGGEREMVCSLFRLEGCLPFALPLGCVFTRGRAVGKLEGERREWLACYS